MMKLVKLLLGFTVLLILMIMIICVGALVFFDPNQHKDFIISQVEETTGRDFNLAGNISLSYYPWLGIEAAGVTLGNADGFGDQPFMQLDSIALRIKTLPLFSKQYELDTLKLQGLKINLAKNTEGKSNWDDLTGKQDTKQQPQKTKEPLPLAAVILGGVDIKDAYITWHDQGSDQKINLSKINATTGELTYGDPIKLAIDLIAEANKPSLKSNIQLNGVMNYNLETEIYAFKPIDLMASITGKDVPGGSTELKFKSAIETNLAEDTFTVSDLSLNVLGTDVKGDIKATNIKSGLPVSTSHWIIKSDDLARLYQIIDPDVASELAKLANRSVDMKIKLTSDLKQDLVKVTDMDIKVLGAVIQGQVEANNLQSKVPAARGNLKATGPDLPAIMQVIGQFQAGKEPGLKTLGRRLAGVKNKAFDISAEFDSNLQQGNINVPNFSVNTLGIAAKGQVDGQKLNSNKPQVDGKFNFKGENLAGLLNALDKKELADVLQAITVDTEIRSKGDSIALSPFKANATFSGKQIPNSPANIILNADTLINVEKQTLTMNNMNMKGLGFNIAGNINANKILSGGPSISGDIKADGKDLSLLFELAGVQSLADQIAQIGDRSFRINTKLNADLEQGNVNVSDLDAKLVGATIKGQVDARNIQSEKLAAKGVLNASGPDLPTLLQVIGKLGGPKSGLADLGKKLGKAPNKSFKMVTEFDADLNKGNINLPVLDVNTLGLAINGKLNTKGLDNKNGTVDGKFSLKGKNISAVLEALGQGGLGEVIQSISIDAGVKGNQENIAFSPLAAVAMFAGKNIPNSPVAIKFNTESAGINLNNQQLNVKQLTLNGLGLSLAANLNAIQVLTEPKFNGDLTIADFNLRDFATKLNQKLPVTSDKSVLQKVGLKTTFTGSTKDLSLKDLVLRLDNSQLNGNLSVKHFTQPRFKFDIGIDSINVDRYLPPESNNAGQQKPGKKNKAPTSSNQAGLELPVELLRTLNMKGKMFIGQFVISNIELSKVNFTVNANDGYIKIDPIAAELYKGTYQGGLTLNTKGKLPILNMNSNLNNVGISPLVKAYTQEPSQVAGKAYITAQVNSKGKTTDQLKKGLNGKADIRVEKGILRGIDVRKTLEVTEIAIESKRIPSSEPQGGETHFDQMTGTLNINNGVVRNNDLLLVSPGFKLKGGIDRGTMLANLHDESIKYDAFIASDKTRTTRDGHNYNVGGRSIPIHCQGRFTDIKTACKPDVSGVVTEILGNVIFDGLGEKLGIPSEGSATPEKESPLKLPVEKILDEVF